MWRGQHLNVPLTQLCFPSLASESLQKGSRFCCPLGFPARRTQISRQRAPARPNHTVTIAGQEGKHVGPSVGPEGVGGWPEPRSPGRTRGSAR